MDSRTKIVIKQLLSSPVAYYTDFARLGGVEVAVFLSQLFYWHGRGEDPEGWIYKTQNEWESETGMTRRNQETARKKLKALDILQEEKRGVPAKLYYRLDVEKLFAKLECRNAPRQDGGMRQTRMAECATQVRRNAPNINTENTTENTAENTQCVLADASRTPTEQQEYFGKICEIVGWDYNAIDKDSKGQVAQTVGILKRNGYTLEELNRFGKDVWAKDWRWKKNKDRPTLKQLRQEIGKLRAPSLAQSTEGYQPSSADTEFTVSAETEHLKNNPHLIGF